MIFFLDLDLVISKKSIHEGKDLMSSACIDNMIDEGCGKFSLGHAQFISWKSMQTWMVPYFLFMGIGLEAQVMYEMG